MHAHPKELSARLLQVTVNLGMDGRMFGEESYSTEFQRRRTVSSRPGGMARYLQGLDGEHLLLCLVSAIAMYAAGYIIARLFFSGIMFFLSVGLLAFLVMQVVDGVDSSVGDAKYHNA